MANPSTNSMIIFITCLRHPERMASKQRTYALLERTARSVCAQTDTRFNMLVVCHEKPAIGFSHPNLEYLLVDMPPPPANLTDYNMRMDALRHDRGLKYLAALYHIRSTNPSHIMFLDADDCLSNKVAEHVLKNPASQSWCVDQGYYYKEEGRAIFIKRRDFHKVCGTCFVFSHSIFSDLPENKADVSIDWVKSNLGSHVLVHPFLKEKGAVLQPFPFKAAIYIIGNGENDSGNQSLIQAYKVYSRRNIKGMLSLLKNLRPLCSNIKKEFGLYRLPRP